MWWASRIKNSFSNLKQASQARLIGERRSTEFFQTKVHIAFRFPLELKCLHSHAQTTQTHKRKEEELVEMKLFKNLTSKQSRIEHHGNTQANILAMNEVCVAWSMCVWCVWGELCVCVFVCLCLCVLIKLVDFVIEVTKASLLSSRTICCSVGIALPCVLMFSLNLILICLCDEWFVHLSGGPIRNQPFLKLPQVWQTTKTPCNCTDWWGCQNVTTLHHNTKQKSQTKITIARNDPQTGRAAQRVRHWLANTSLMCDVDVVL